MKNDIAMGFLNMVAKFMLLCILLFAFYTQPGCKDPSEFEPESDSLIEPPGPPHLVSPFSGFVIMFESVPADSYYILEWTTVDQADGYQVEYTIDTNPPFLINCPVNTCTIWVFDTTGRIREHYWRVRASSLLWTWFTEWSEQWQLELRMRPSGPRHLTPQDGSIFYTDSLPIDIELQWEILQDEEFYEVAIFKDSLPYDQCIIYNNQYRVVIYENGQYSWQVRAKSSFWQYYSYWSNPWFFFVSSVKSEPVP